MKGTVRDIVQLFGGVDNELHIPVYQRNYDWGEAQCARLFDDLIEVIRFDRKKHFFGAVVGNAELLTWVVIDGQQRLTTTSILMLAIADSLEEGVVKSSDPELGKIIKRNYLVRPGSTMSGENKLKLKPVKDDLDAYRRLLSGEQPIEKSTVTANYRYFRERIAKQELDGDELWNAVNRLEVMALDLESHDDPQRIFESLNSTGKELKESDKIRNLVLMELDTKTQNDLYERYWNRIEKNVEFDTDTFVRLYLVSRTRKTPRFDAVYEAFRKYLQDQNAPIESVLQDMHQYSGYYFELNTAATGVAAADRRLCRFNLMQRDVAMPTMMPLVADLKSGAITPEDFTRIVTIIDSYLFRRTVVGDASNALNKIFATLYNEATRIRTENTDLAEVISYLLLKRAETSGRFPEDDEFRLEFATRNFYKFRSQYRQYIFECLENRNSKDHLDVANALQDGSASIEHIMPRTLTKEWRNELGEDAEETHEKWVHRIGNLTITGYNSEYSNYSFAKKKSLPEGFDSSPYRLNNYVRQVDSWGPEEITERTNRLTEQALEYWPMLQTEFVPVVEPLPTVPLGEYTDFKHQKIVSYEFDDSKHSVKSFKEMVRGVCLQLLSEHHEGVYAYAEEDGFGFALSNEPVKDFGELTPGLWVLLDCNTSKKMTVLRRLFHYLDIDTDSLVITLRKESSARDEGNDDEPTGKHAELTKFIPQFEELEGSRASDSDIASLQSEYNEVLAEFARSDWQQFLADGSYPNVSDPVLISQRSIEELLASLSALRQAETFVPGQFRTACIDGTFAKILQRLEDIDVPAE
ncbi:DUF262 domain-containing protein [Corynebacterium propinquum]|uniref:DUF262 domain-containing protein n=1 Tax=Corynebacterium propinquum TaxID=43769 RepID=UPI00191CD2A7|nr:DUF262 domain-containing protein [Corynebacterium propinquum]MDK4235619.1 DUF262 domain-containing protein [Corynebacterium propinquum]MDK4252102.1 DUF262 domain-containing protein [Corynebacterium propinquum]MDK4292729.1 DUF262 domain-containing protein [Corynebacterium propinquum]QQU86077.1 DUF262 domain-containing protein [Corynebacterium propinquum]